jgi:Domain of unknown function (DUF1996)
MIDRPSRVRNAALACAVVAAVAMTAPAARAESVVPGFVISCTLNHRASDDPIVMPGQPGMAMLHDFFGNTKTDAYSTTSSLRTSGSTTCGATKDRSAYWTPSVVLNGYPVQPTRLRAYYRAGTKDPASIRTFPKGLVMIAGDAGAKSYQPESVVAWGCGVGSNGTAPVPTCHPKALVLHVYFPDCWDGQHVDSANHHSHMAYTHNGACPSSHPVPLPKLTEDVQYPIQGGPSVKFEYSSTAKSGHADFMQAWDSATLTTLVRKCLVERSACGMISD